MKNNSIYKTLGASNHTEKERETNDYYATDSIAIDKLLTVENPNQNIWECACGRGDLSKRLQEYKFKVKSTDLIYRDYGIGNVDFLKCKEFFNGDILTNPPYKLAIDFVLKALELIPTGNKVYMFLKIQFLEGQTRREKLFNSNPPKYIYVFSKRILCAKNANFTQMKLSGGSAVAYAWYVWEKGYQEQPIIKWI